MKKLYLIGGTMGIGKTSVCKRLNVELTNSVFLDGDWCWDTNPFQVTEETKKMVIDNITYILNNYINCSTIHNIVFCWVMDKKYIIDEIISNINIEFVEVITISLICSEEELKNRLMCDIQNGIRESDIIERSIGRLPLYDALDTIKIDVSNRTVRETTKIIRKI